ncbi:MAG: MFS transporter [Spirochaetales bacterium]|nr:MFS transporter [Spirochaetales bacterium]
MSSSINVALPVIGNELSMNSSVLGWVATSYLLAAAVFLVPFGRIADIRGRKAVFLIGLLGYGVSSFLCGIAGSAVLLIVFRVLHGITTAMIFSTAIAILTSVFPPGERGKALGINVACTYFGLSIGPVIGGIMTQQLGWRSIFYVHVPLAVVAFVLVAWKLPADNGESKGERFDLPGAFLFGLSLAALMYGLSLLPRLTGLWVLIVALASLAGFVAVELRVRQPLLNIDLFRRNTVFAFSNLAALINYSATFAVGFLLSYYLQFIRGFTPQQSGLVLIAQPVVMALFSPFAGRLSDRVGSRILASAGMAVAAVGLLWLSFAGQSVHIGFIIGALVVLGFGFALFSSPNTNAIMSSVERRYYGVASATLGTMRLTGQMLSMGTAILIFTLFIGDAKVTAAVRENLQPAIRTAFIIFATVCFLGIFASMARGPMRPREETKEGAGE